MDLNQLLYHHQIALIDRAARDKNDDRRGSRFDLARHYETRIARLRHDMGVATYPRWSRMSTAELLCLPSPPPSRSGAIWTAPESQA